MKFPFFVKKSKMGVDKPNGRNGLQNRQIIFEMVARGCGSMV